MSDSTLLHNASPEQLTKLFAKELDRKFEELKTHFQPKEPDEFLTRKEVSEMLKVDISTVHNWTVKGILTKYSIGDKVYYKRSEVLSAIQKISL